MTMRGIVSSPKVATELRDHTHGLPQQEGVG